jgi:hypothetical protein
VIECHWQGSFLPPSEVCTGEATEFFHHPDLNTDAKDEIWQMALCATCAQRLIELEGLVRISRDEYLVYKVMNS